MAGVLVLAVISNMTYFYFLSCWLYYEQHERRLLENVPDKSELARTPTNDIRGVKQVRHLGPKAHPAHSADLIAFLPALSLSFLWANDALNFGSFKDTWESSVFADSDKCLASYKYVSCGKVDLLSVHGLL